MSQAIQDEILKYLEKMGCTNITFSNAPSNQVTVSFDCKDLTSFTADLPGWKYTGIELDPTGARQYKMEFYRAK